MAKKVKKFAIGERHNAKLAAVKKKARPAVDSRGRLIGKRAHREPPGEGLINITGIERTILRSVANRIAEARDVSAFARAMALGVGEADFARGGDVQSLAMSISQARKRGELGGRVFNYGHSHVAVESKVASVLWIIRTK